MNGYDLCVIDMSLPETISADQDSVIMLFFFKETDKINFRLGSQRARNKMIPSGVFSSPQSATLLSVLLINTRLLIQSNNLWAFLG